MEDTPQAESSVESPLEKKEIDAIVAYCNEIALPLENDGDKSEVSDSKRSTSESIKVFPDGSDSVRNDSIVSYRHEEIFTNPEIPSSTELKKVSINSYGDVKMVLNSEEVMEMFPDLDSCGDTTDSKSNNDVLPNCEQNHVVSSGPSSNEELLPKTNEMNELCILKLDPEFITGSEGENFRKMECPYTWEDCKSKFTEMDWIGILLCKLSKSSSNCWRLFNLELLLACVYGYDKNYTKALETLKLCEDDLEKNADDTFFANVMDGLRHMIYASKCHIHLINGKKDEALDISSALPSVKELSSASQGAVWASKAYILSMLGDDIQAKALECIKKAIEMDPDDGSKRGAWYYLAGKIYTKIRLLDSRNTIPGKEEMDMYKRAVGKNPFPNHVVVFACLCGEAARGFKARCAFNRRKSDGYFRMSLEMIEKALAENELNLEDTVRIASEMKKLPKSLCPPEIVNLNLKNPLHKLQENFDQMLYDIINNGFRQDLTKNLEDIKDSAVSLIKVMVETNQSPLQIFEKVFLTLQNPLLTKYCVDLKIFFLLMKGEYYLRKKSMLMVVKTWGEAILLAPESPILLNYTTQLLRTQKILNIYEVIKEKVDIVMGSRIPGKKNLRFIKNVLKMCDKRGRNT